MTLVYTNATLSRIAQAGGGDGYSADPVVGPDRWAGAVGVTIRERHVEQIAGGRIDQVDESHLILPYDLGVLVARGDVLVFNHEGATHTRKAGTIVRAQLTGRVRVELEDS